MWQSQVRHVRKFSHTRVKRNSEDRETQTTPVLTNAHFLFPLQSPTLSPYTCRLEQALPLQEAGSGFVTARERVPPSCRQTNAFLNTERNTGRILLELEQVTR